MGGESVIIVHVNVNPERIEDFLTVAAHDAEESRKEPGCLRFDVLRDHTDPNKYVFYEVYRDDEAIAAHKETPHYASWVELNNSGGVLSFSVTRTTAVNASF